jgi:hypothetical protein
MAKANHLHLHEHRDQPNITVVHGPNCDVLGYIERVALAVPQIRTQSFGSDITKVWQPQDKDRRPLTDYVETHPLALKRVDEQ